MNPRSLRDRERLPSFSPRDLSAVKYWIDAGEVSGVADGGTIVAANVRDLSSYALGVLVSAANIVWRLDGGNGRPCLEFNGTTSTAVTPSFVIAQPVYVMAVLKQLTWTLNDRFWDGNTQDKACLIQSATTPNISMFAVSSAQPTDTTPVLDSIFMVDCFYSGASSTIRVNQNSAVTGSPGTNGYTDGMQLGSRGDAGAAFCNYQLFELIVADSTLTAAGRAALRKYLYA